MPRQPRFNIPGYPQHVVLRGVNRSRVFVDSQDRRFFLELLKDGCNRFDCKVHAYVLMTNHVHILITPEAAGCLSRLMQSSGVKYVRNFNRRHSRTGTLWEDRYNAGLIATDAYLMATYRYIELNPVSAGIVPQPEAYPWSSFRRNALNQYDPLISPHPLYDALGLTPAARAQAYRNLFRDELEEQTVLNIRAATRGNWVIGDQNSANEITKKIGRQASPRPRGGHRFPKV